MASPVLIGHWKLDDSSASCPDSVVGGVGTMDIYGTVPRQTPGPLPQRGYRAFQRTADGIGGMAPTNYALGLANSGLAVTTRGELSLAFWIRRTVPSPDDTLANILAQELFHLGGASDTATPGNGIHLAIASSNGDVQVYWDTWSGATKTRVQAVDGSGSGYIRVPKDGLWHHVAVVRTTDGGSSKLVYYLDGALIVQYTGFAWPTDGGGSDYLIAMGWQRPDFGALDQDMADVRLYSGTLTSVDVSNLYFEGIPTLPSPALEEPDDRFGLDISTFPDLDAGMSLQGGGRVLSEAIARRLSTRRGTMSPFDADYGTDIRDYLNQEMTSEALHRVKTDVEAEAEKDERVEEAYCTVEFDEQSQALSIQLELATAEGPFSLRLAVTELSLSVLTG